MVGGEGITQVLCIHSFVVSSHEYELVCSCFAFLGGGGGSFLSLRLEEGNIRFYSSEHTRRFKECSETIHTSTVHVYWC